ncbi:MAG TPA: CoA transferase [Gemmatimonadaceae bacterium]|nr:CoA transferase [Gemmatimonadaceae bacterium]
MSDSIPSVAKHNGALGPLDGVRVLDLSRVLAGPLCTMMLGDLGADVIKVEHPRGGDETRGWGPPFDDRGESAYFLGINRNKLSVAADLGTPEGRSLVRRLALDADVVVDNFRAGTLERFGLDPDALLADRPSLVWLTITGFGPDSPRPGYDYVVQAECGWMSITGEPDGEPMKAGVALADVVTGKDAAVAILGALVARGRTGKGARLFVSLAASATAALINAAQNVLVSGRDARRWGNGHPNLVPYQLFRAADRPFVIAVGNDGQWRACARVLELADLAADPSLATNPGRVEQRERVVRAVSARVRERPASHWLPLLEGAGVPCGVVRTVLEALERVEASPLTGVASPVGGTVRFPPPRLDEHGAGVREVGWEIFGRAARDP